MKVFAFVAPTLSAASSTDLWTKRREAKVPLTVYGSEMMTVGIFNFYIGGSVNEAAALGLILIILGALCLFTISKIAGTRMGGVFG